MNIEKIIKLTASDMKQVNIEIYSQLHSEVTLINKLSHYIISSGGKRIRPIIAILVAKALQYKGQKHITIATLIEFIHTATLLHDDVVDKSNIRRGKATINSKFGNSISVLVGDFIYTRALQMMITLESLPILKIISKTVNILAEGEVLQLMYCHNPDITIDHYMKIIHYKTAQLFKMASQSSAILAGANSDQEMSLRNYGYYLGTAFQLIDDILDYSSDKKTLGKNIGNDLYEGKLTLPLLHAMHHGNPNQVKIIRKAIKQGNSCHLLNVILEIMYQYNSLEYTLQCAKKEANKAIMCLNCLSPSLYREALIDLVYITIHRKF